MLESPQDESVVRWGNEGDSFVVLEVRCVRKMVLIISMCWSGMLRSSDMLGFQIVLVESASMRGRGFCWGHAQRKANS